MGASAGGDWDVESLDDYSEARCHDLGTGRFTVLDQIDLGHASLTPYSYVAANPVKFLDNHGGSQHLGEKTLLRIPGHRAHDRVHQN